MNNEPRTPNLRNSENGLALLMTLLLTSLLTTLGLALMLLSTGEVWLGAAYRTSEELSYAADAAIARVQIDLARAVDWTPLLAAAGPASAFNDGAELPQLADGSTIDLNAETTVLQARTDALYGSSNPDRPVWRLFAHAPLSRLASGPLPPAIYVAAWIADDVEDGDGNVLSDANGRVYVQAEAFGPAGARRGVRSTFARAAGAGPGGAPSAVQLLIWREQR
jgi:hypothetical protein